MNLSTQNTRQINPLESSKSQGNAEQENAALRKERNLVICLDGTWNNPESSTNVYSLYQDAQGIDARDKSPFSVKDEPQIRYYDEGVGSGTMRVIAGATGLGLSRNIREAYDFICRHYQDGDQLFVFGFSRGAYTARSLVGLISAIGLLPRNLIDPKIPAGSSAPEAALKSEESFSADLLQAAMDAYKANNVLKQHRRKPGGRIMQRLNRLRNKQTTANKAGSTSKPQTCRSHVHRDFAKRWNCRLNIRVHFLGVWDTVGALGVPNFLPTFIQRHKADEMHDTEMCSIVDFAYHALAIDEHRRAFAHTPWTKIHPKNQAVEQRWFVGAHANIGGGVNDSRLHGAAQNWLVGKALEQGLQLHHPLAEDADWRLEPINNSYREFMFGLYCKLPARQYHLRQIALNHGVEVQHNERPESRGQSSIKETIDDSVWQYLDAHPDYRPLNLPHDARPNQVLDQLSRQESTERCPQQTKSKINPSAFTRNPQALRHES